jgi:hypothetical protein
MSHTFSFQFPLLLPADPNNVVVNVYAELKPKTSEKPTPIAGTLASSETPTQQFDHFKNLQYHLECNQCELTLTWKVDGAVDKKIVLKQDIKDLSIDIAAAIPPSESESTPINATLLRGSVVIPIAAGDSLNERLVKCWPFARQLLTALRLEPAGFHVQGIIPKAFTKLWQSAVAIDALPSDIALRCPQGEYDAVEKANKHHPYWTLASTPLRDASASEALLSAIDFVNANQNVLSTYENKSWLDNVRSDLTDRTHVRFFTQDASEAGVTNTVHWEALHTATRITIAAGEGLSRSAETHFLPDAIAGTVSYDGTKMEHPVSWMLFERRKGKRAPEPGKRERRFVSLKELVPAATTLKAVSKKQSGTTVNTAELKDLELVCHEAPLQRRSAEQVEQSEIWCCTDDGWLSWQGQKLLEESVDFGRQFGQAGLTSPIDLLPLLAGTVGNFEFPAEAMLLLNASDETRIACQLSEDSASLLVDKPTCFFRTPRVFLAEPQLTANRNDISTDAPAEVGQAVEVDGQETTLGLQTSPLAIPTIRSQSSSGQDLNASLREKFTAATFVSKITKRGADPIGLTASLKVDIAKKQLVIIYENNPAKWKVTRWADSKIPLARTFPDPQTNQQFSTTTSDGTMLRFLDENRGLHPSRKDDGATPLQLVFKGTALPNVKDGNAYPEFDARWIPDSRFAAMRSFLTTLPGIEYEYPSKPGNDGTATPPVDSATPPVNAKWGYRYANPALDEAYAMVVEDSDRVGDDYLFDLNGPDTTRVIHAVAFKEDGKSADFLVPVSMKGRSGSVSIGALNPNFSAVDDNQKASPTLDGQIANAQLKLSRPKKGEEVAADTLPPLDVEATWDTNIPVIKSIKVSPFGTGKPSNVVGHGQPLLATKHKNMIVVQDALGTAMMEPAVASNSTDSVKHNSWQIPVGIDKDVSSRTRLTGKLELTLPNNVQWHLHLSGVSTGQFDNLFPSDRPSTIAFELSQERWSLHQGDAEPTLWGFPFIPTRLAKIDENGDLILEGILCPYDSDPTADRSSRLTSLSGQEILKLTFNRTEGINQLSYVSGKIDWRFAVPAERRTESTAELVRLLAKVTWINSSPSFAIEELACNTPVGLVRMTEPANGRCDLVETSIPPYLLVAVTDWSPWKVNTGLKPTTNHSVGPFLIRPGDHSPQLKPYDFQWITPSTTEDDPNRTVISTVAFGTTPEFREDDLVNHNSMKEALQQLVEADLALLSGIEGDSDDKFSDNVRNLLLASPENKRRLAYFGEQITSQINEWIAKGNLNGLKNLVNKINDSTNRHIDLANTSSPQVIALAAETKEEVKVDLSGVEEITPVHFAETIASYKSSDKGFPNPQLQGWELKYDPSTNGELVEEFDQFVQLRVGDKPPIQFCFADKRSNGWSLTPLAQTKYWYETGKQLDKAKDWIANLIIELPSDYKSGFSWTVNHDNTQYQLTFEKTDATIVVRGTGVTPETIKMDISLTDPIKSMEVHAFIKCVKGKATVYANDKSFNEWTGQVVEASNKNPAIGLATEKATATRNPLIVKECQLYVLQAKESKGDYSYELQLTAGKTFTVSRDAEAKDQQPFEITPLKLSVFKENVSGKPELSFVDLSVVHVSETIVSLTNSMALPPHAKKWVLRHLLHAVLRSRSKAITLFNTWENDWHARGTLKETGTETSLLGDVMLRPMQLTADQILFEVTQQAYFDQPNRAKLNSHLRIRPTGGFYGAQVHWKYDDRPFLHFRQNAFELQLHLTDRRRRDALAIWTPPSSDEEMDELHVRDDSVGEIQAFDGFSPATLDVAQDLELFWVTHSGQMKRWQPFGRSRLTDKQLQWDRKLPLIELLVARKRNPEPEMYLLVDDIGHVFELEKRRNSNDVTVTSLSRAITNSKSQQERDTRFVATSIAFHDDPAIALKRRWQNDVVLEVQVSESLFLQTKTTILSADFLDNDKTLLWTNESELWGWKTEDNINKVTLGTNLNLSGLCVVKDQNLLIFNKGNNRFLDARIMSGTELTENLTDATFRAKYNGATPRSTLFTDLLTCISIGDFVAVESSTGWSCAEVALDNGSLQSLHSKPLKLSDVELTDAKRLLESFDSKGKGHLIARGEGSQTNCIGILSYCTTASKPSEEQQSDTLDPAKISDVSRLSLQLTGKIVLQNDIIIEEPVFINNLRDEAECTHRVDLFVDRAEVPVELLFSGPKKDTVITAVAQHVFRFPRGGGDPGKEIRPPKELRWQCAQPVRFSTAGRLGKFLDDNVEPSDSRLVIDASHVVLLKPLPDAVQDALTGGHTGEGGGGLLRNRFVETTLQPVRPTGFDRTNKNDVPALVRIPMLASPSFEPRDSVANREAGQDPKPLKRPRITLEIDNAKPINSPLCVGAQFSVLSPSPQSDSSYLQQEASDDDTGRDEADDQRIDFIFRNGQAAWLDSRFLGYTMSPENPRARHELLEWSGTDIASDTANVLPTSPVLFDDVKAIWSKDGKWSDLAPLRLNCDGPLPSASGRYQGNRVICAAASITRKQLEGHDGLATGPCLFEFPFYVSTNRFSEETTLGQDQPNSDQSKQKVEVQLVVYEQGRFRRLSHDLLSIGDSERQGNDSHDFRNETVAKWGRQELNRRRRFTGAFVVIDFRETLLIPPHSTLGDSDLNEIPDFGLPQTTDNNDQIWPMATNPLMTGRKDPRFVRSLETGKTNLRLKAQTDTAIFAYAAEPSCAGEENPKPVSSTVWRLAAKDNRLTNAAGHIPLARTFDLAKQNKIPLMTWRESIPFEVTNGSGDFPQPLWQGRTALYPYSAELNTDQQSVPDSIGLNQWVRPPRLDLNAWSARPGEITTNSWMTAEVTIVSGSRDIAMSAESRLSLRRARAVAGPDELVMLKTADQQVTLVEPLKDRFTSLNLVLQQQVARSTLADNTLMMALVTSSEVHIAFTGENGRDAADSRPVMLAGDSDGNVNEPVQFHFISKATDLIQNNSILVLMRIKEATPDNFSSKENLLEAAIGELKNSTFSGGPNKYRLQKNEQDVTFNPKDRALYAVARYMQSSDGTSFTLNTIYCWLSVILVDSQSRFRPPSMAVAVISDGQRLVGYGHLDNRDFSLIEPHFSDATQISWQRRAALNVLHRKKGGEDPWSYDIVVTGPAGQTYPTVDEF